MGFTKNAQTMDHILTLKTVIDKYKKRSQKVYCVFVDLRKAFDSVPRSALLYKLAQMGVRGNVFSVIKNMYENSTCQLKLNNKLSRKLNIRKGTEQGHTLSPELFKSYLQDASPLLNFGNIPEIDNMLLSHLLWADDLALIALDLDTAQKLFGTFVDYCKSWGLEINQSKTELVVFNKKTLKGNEEFVYLEETPIKTVASYTYLGVTLHMNGSMSAAVQSLRAKAIRAVFALRKYVVRDNLSFKSLLNLFDALVKPILLYGSSIWAPLQPASKTLLKTLTGTATRDNLLSGLLDKFARDPIESVQLRFIKWAFGVHKYASNTGCWGDSGRLPILDAGIRQAFKYLERLEKLPTHLLVRKAMNEQAALSLPWYSMLNALRSGLGSYSSAKQPFLGVFSEAWSCTIKKQTKLDFYRLFKSSFTCSMEGYLNNITNYKHRSTITRLRVSSHQLAIETGRYDGLQRSERICATCDMGVVDDEQHFLVDCRTPDLESMRASLRHSLRLNENSPGIDAPSVFKLTSLSNLDPHQKEHLQQICKLIHTMYDAKLAALEELEKNKLIV